LAKKAKRNKKSSANGTQLTVNNQDNGHSGQKTIFSILNIHIASHFSHFSLRPWNIELRTNKMKTVISELLKIAQQKIEFSYSPYSEFQVSAALLTSSGKIFDGVNVENSSYGLTNCAERTAVFKAVSEGYRDFSDILIFAPKAMPYPCGACRQVLSEFATPDMNIHVATIKDDEPIIETYSLQELLPKSFNLK
jgi:cytidine deaminase